MPVSYTHLAVIACDQYTSQPDYWAETDKTVGDAPSTPVSYTHLAHAVQHEAV